MSGMQRAQARPYAANNSGTRVDCRRPVFTVLHVAGAGWIVLDREGVKCSAPVDSKHVAQARRDRLQADADRRAKRGARPCMCCGAVFESQGIHNRLCGMCGRRQDPMGTAHRARLPQRRDNA
jgi:hypothetical protein